MSKNYHEVFGQKFSTTSLDHLYRESFEKNIIALIEAKRIDPELKKFNYEEIKKAFVPKRDYLLNYLGIQTLYDRYFLQINDRRMEAPQHFWMRVTIGIALAEKEENRTQKAIEFYHELSQLQTISSTPNII